MNIINKYNNIYNNIYNKLNSMSFKGFDSENPNFNNNIINIVNNKNNNNNNIIHNESFSIYKNIFGRELFENKFIKLNTLKKRNSYLKFIVWNCRHMTNNIKINFIKRIINIEQPDFIYIIDSNYDNLGNWKFYDKFFDKRNILYIRNEIKYEINIIKENYIKITNLNLNFIYITPNNDDKLFWINNLETMIRNDENIIGDINIRSNTFIKNIIEKYNYKKFIAGENTLQTIIITKNLRKLKTFLAPSDHQVLYTEIYAEFYASSFLKLNYIKNNTDYDQVVNILEGKQLELNFNYKIKNIRLCMNDKYLVIRKIISFFLKNNPTLLYKFFNNVWSKFKKEPLLGDNVSTKIIESIKLHLKDNRNKKKILFNQKDILGFKTFPEERIELIRNKSQKLVRHFNLFKIKGAGSHAKTEDFLGLHEIGDKIKIYCENKKFIKKLDDVQNILFNLFTYCNNNNITDKSKVFYLIKNNKLENFADVRLITILPTTFRIFEALTYYEIVEGLNHIINSRIRYQFGALNNSGTISAINHLKYKLDKLDNSNKNKGLLVSDISFGYDSVDWDILDKFIENDNRLNNIRLKKLLKFWNIFNKNMNLWISNDQIKRSIGVPMGSALSPVIFIYYVDNCLLNFEYKQDLVMYLDDLTLLINYNDNPKIKIYKLKKALSIGKLELKEKKTFIITTDKLFFKDISNKYNIVERFTFLGRDLIYVNEDIIQNDESIVIIDKNRIKKFPNWLLLCEKRILFNGALQAKQRFISFMMSINDINIRKEHLKNIFNFYNNSFDHLRYKMILFITTNLFRFFIDSFSLFKLIENFRDNANKIKEINKTKKISLNYNNGIVFTDGSFNDKFNSYGCGFVLIFKNDVNNIIKISCSTGSNNKDLIKFRNISGEIIAIENAINQAIVNRIDNLIIYYDYIGIGKWLDNSWSCNNNLTKEFKNYILNIKKKINLRFIKIKAHSNVFGNEEADKLAKLGANNQKLLFKNEKISLKDLENYNMDIGEYDDIEIQDLIEDQSQITKIIRRNLKMNTIDKEIDEIIDNLDINLNNYDINKINIDNCFSWTKKFLDDIWYKFKIEIALKYFEKKNFNYENYIYIKDSLTQCSLINKHSFLLENAFLNHRYWSKEFKKLKREFLLDLIIQWKDYIINILNNSLDNIKKHLNIIDWLNTKLSIINDCEERENKIFGVLRFTSEEIITVKINKIFKFLIELENTKLLREIHNINKNKRGRSSKKEFELLRKDIWKITRTLIYNIDKLWYNDKLFILSEGEIILEIIIGIREHKHIINMLIETENYEDYTDLDNNDQDDIDLNSNDLDSEYNNNNENMDFILVLNNKDNENFINIEN